MLELNGGGPDSIILDELSEEGAKIETELDPNGIDAHAPGAKLDAGKDDWYLPPWDVIAGAVRILTFGKQKYSKDGWKEVPDAKERYFAALMRHWRKMESGEYIDPESGEPHWKHFVTNALFLGYFYNKEQ